MRRTFAILTPVANSTLPGLRPLRQLDQPAALGRELLTLGLLRELLRCVPLLALGRKPLLRLLRVVLLLGELLLGELLRLTLPCELRDDLLEGREQRRVLFRLGVGERADPERLQRLLQHRPGRRIIDQIGLAGGDGRMQELHDRLGRDVALLHLTLLLRGLLGGLRRLILLGLLRLLGELLTLGGLLTATGAGELLRGLLRLGGTTAIDMQHQRRAEFFDKRVSNLYDAIHMFFRQHTSSVGYERASW